MWGLGVIICSPTFYGIIKKKSVEEFKPDPYLATVLNCAFWVFYGLPFVHPHSILVLTINSVGLVFEFVYLTIFYVYANNKGRVRYLSLIPFYLYFSLFIIIIILKYKKLNFYSFILSLLVPHFNFVSGP